MKCLRCDVGLEVKVVGEGPDVVEIDVCPECAGIWLDSEEMAKLDDNLFINVEEISFTKVQPSSNDEALSCPRCESTPVLIKVKPDDLGDVVIDKCSSCNGFWLDKGELDKMKEVSDRALIASLTSLDD